MFYLTLYLFSGLLVTSVQRWLARRFPTDEDRTCDIKSIASKRMDLMHFPDGLPLSLRLAQTLGSGLAAMIGLSFWPIILLRMLRQRTSMCHRCSDARKF